MASLSRNKSVIDIAGIIPPLKLTEYIPHKPTPKQYIFLLLKCLDAFYGGAAGGGKSDALLMAALQYVDIPGYNAIILRNTYANLSKPEGLLDRAAEWLAGQDVKWNGSINQWRFPSRATLSFGYLDGPMDHYNYQGPAYQFVGIDEIVQIRKNQATYMFSRMRKKVPSSYIEDLRKFDKYKHFPEEKLLEFYEQYKELPLRFRATSNPPQPEQLAKGAWVKRRYVDPMTRKPDKVFISAKIDDNPHLDKESYVKSLNELDPVTKAQLLKGDWDIRVKGRMFDRSWFEIVDAFPAEGNKVRFWDMAATEPSKENKDPDYTAGCKMVEKDGIYYMNMIRFRKSPSMNEKLIRQVADMDGREMKVCMEQEPGSSGKSQVDHYRRHILPEFVFEGIPSSGSKRQRAMPFASQAEAGNIKLVNGPWVEDYLDEIEVFPDGEHDDQVDASSGAFDRLAGAHTKIKMRFV
jgi:predicted phage terminase large subunit-like protein